MSINPMANTSDSYLDNISNESLQVLSHFGPEAPVKLNTYACQVEDALIEALQAQQKLEQLLAKQNEYINTVQTVLQSAAAERESMLATLSNADQLIAYVSRFFGPEGPCPGGAVISRCLS